MCPRCVHATGGTATRGDATCRRNTGYTYWDRDENEIRDIQLWEGNAGRALLNVCYRSVRAGNKRARIEIDSLSLGESRQVNAVDAVISRAVVFNDIKETIRRGVATGLPLL